MGQRIEVATSIVGDVAVFDTDRTFTGQDGEHYGSADEATAGVTFPAQLAARLFAADERVSHVYAFSNVVSVGRSGGWDDPAAAHASRVISDFFIFYDENKAP